LLHEALPEKVAYGSRFTRPQPGLKKPPGQEKARALAILSAMRHSSHTSGDGRWQDRIDCAVRGS
jgi:hypothetical protein